RADCAAGGRRGAARDGAARDAGPAARRAGREAGSPALKPLARLAAGAAASALAFGLYARVEPPWIVLGWIGLVPWLATLDRASSLWVAVASGVVFSVCFTLAVFGWFAAAIGGYTGAPWPVAVAVLVLCAPLLQPQLVVFAAARHAAR